MGMAGTLAACRTSARVSGPSRPPLSDVSGSPLPVGAPPSATAAPPVEPWASLTGFCEGVPPPDAAEREGHRERMRKALTDAGHALLVVEPGPTMEYLSGVRWGRSERPFLLALPRDGEPWWVVPGFEQRTAREQLGGDAQVLPWQEHQSPYDVLAAGLAERGRGRGTVAVDENIRHFISDGLATALGARRVVSGAAVVQGQRMRKQPAELARLRRANEATKAALRLVAEAGVPVGMRQSELAERIRAAQMQAGLTNVWVLALFGPNAAFPHGTADDRALRPDDLVLVDTGGALHGYRSDITRTWAPGDVSEPARKAWATVAEAQAAALATIAPGVACGEVDAAARAVIERAGFGTGYHRFTHRLGHGIGLEVHEHPYLVQDATRKLEPGMTMSDEPGIYVPGQFGVRIEDIVAVTEDGHEVFGPLVSSLEQPFGAAP